MPKVRKNDLKGMGENDLKNKLNALNKELMKINTKRAMGVTLESPGQARSIRKTIARVHTFLAQKLVQKKQGGSVKKT
ncbi:MAG: 50S ribosomal protein L29 [Nanoarchaeota archaeon]